MKKSQNGFSSIEGLLVIFIIALVSVIGFYVVGQGHKARAVLDAASNSSASTLPKVSSGSASSIESLTAADTASENSIDAEYTASDASDGQSGNAEANNVGESFDESSL